MRRSWIWLVTVGSLVGSAPALAQGRPAARPEEQRKPAAKPIRPAPRADERVDAFLKKLGKTGDARLSRKDVEGTELAVIFARLDSNGDGYLDRDELLQAAEYLPEGERRIATESPAPRPAVDRTPKGPSITPAELLVVKTKVKDFLRQYDTNEDGKIDRAEFKALFQRMDLNEDGAVDKNEMRAAALALSKAPASPPATRREPEEVHSPAATEVQQRVDLLLKELDADRDGKISRAEAKGTKLALVFDRLDRNQDGFLDRSELLRAADQLPPVAKAPEPGKASELDLRLFFFLKQFDTNQDGKLDWDEAQAMFQRLDRNRDGTLDEQELLAAAVLGWPAGAREIDPVLPPRTEVISKERRPEVDPVIAALLREFDRDRDGRLSREEVAALFERLDANRDGYLDRDELRQAAQLLLRLAERPAAAAGERPGVRGGVGTVGGVAIAELEQRVRYFIAQLDKDGDGKISLKEAQGTPLADVFDDLDLNKDGYLDRDELLKEAKRLAQGGRPLGSKPGPSPSKNP
jgi:Ca2+-binding EF-hand superfamily protein